MTRFGWACEAFGNIAEGEPEFMLAQQGHTERMDASRLGTAAESRRRLGGCLWGMMEERTWPRND